MDAEFTGEVEIRVRYAETDAAGIVYHGNFFPWFESARVALLDARGLPYRELERLGFRLPVLEAEAKFHAPAFFDDRLTVRCRTGAPRGLRVEITYEVRRGGDLLATGRTLHAFVNHRGQPVRPPPAFRAAFATSS